MHPRARHLIAELGLAPHPEGGFFREVYRSPARVRPEGGAERRALTTIFFLLPGGAHSRWHRVAADEVWHFYEGAPLELLRADPALDRLVREQLGPASAEASPVRVVPAGWWQAARAPGDFTLVGCTVAPGFEFADFALAASDPAAAAALRARWPELDAFV